jgi:hypothetical protein
LQALSALAVAAAAWLSVRDGAEPSVAECTGCDGGTVAAQAAGSRPIPAPARTPPSLRPDAPAAIRSRAPRLSPPQIAAAGATPPGIAPEHWQRLQAELGSRADGAAESTRLRAYLEYADALKRFQALKAQPGGSSELVALATALDAGLAERQRQRELHGAEAYQVKSAVLEILESDPVVREQRLAAWRAAQAAPTMANTSDVRDAEFLRQQQTLIAAWTAQPPALRDRAQLERDLQALRQRIYRPVGS